MWLEWNIILLSYSYIFTIYFPNNSPLLKSLSSAISNFSCFLTSVLNFSLNSATTSFTFYKFFSLSYILCFTINFFYHTKYFTTPLIFLLFNIFSISHFLTLFTQLNKFSSNLTVIIWQTTKITSFPMTNSNLVMKSTIKCVHSFSGTSFTIKFFTGASV